MTIHLDAQFEQAIRHKVASGHYRDAAEVIREARLALIKRERFLALNAKVAAGFAQAERGALIDFPPDWRGAWSLVSALGTFSDVRRLMPDAYAGLTARTKALTSRPPVAAKRS